MFFRNVRTFSLTKRCHIAEYHNFNRVQMSSCLLQGKFPDVMGHDTIRNDEFLLCYSQPTSDRHFHIPHDRHFHIPHDSVPLFFLSFVSSFVHTSIIPSFILPFVRSFIGLFFHSLIYKFIHSNIHSIILYYLHVVRITTLSLFV